MWKRKPFSLRCLLQVKIVSAIGFVREAMVRLQQSYGVNKGVVMDGGYRYDCFSDAELKIL